MASLKDYAEEMFVRCPDAIGRVAAIASGSTTTVVSSALAFGGNDEQRYAQQWMWRPDTTTTADKTRYSDSFAPATGTLTHSGTNYSDTTFTSENIYICRFEPYQIRDAIDLAIRRLRRLDRTEVWSPRGATNIPIGDMDWIKEPDDIVALAYNPSPVLSRDRYFEKWFTVATDGTLQPSLWTLSGTGATAAKSTDHYWRGSHVVKLTRSSNDAYLTATLPVYRNGVDGYDLRGKSVTFVAWVWGNDTGAKKITLTDGTTTTTDTHAGLQNWEELTAAVTVDDDAETLTFYLSMETNDASLYVGEAYLVETERLSDAARIDNNHDQYLDRSTYGMEQAGTIRLKVPTRGDGQLIVYSKRPYPGFDNARLVSGAADADSSDAPLEAVACGAIARLFKGRAMGDTQSADWVRASEWEAKFTRLAQKHLYLPQRDLTQRVQTIGGLGPRAVRMS